MTDLVQRLRDRAFSSKVPDELCAKAADEIERLRLHTFLAHTSSPSSCAERQPPASVGGGEPLDDCVQTMGSAPGGRGPCNFTSAEREAVSAGLGAIEALHADGAPIGRPIHEAYAPTLRRLLARTAKKLSESDSSRLTDDERAAMEVAVEYVGSAFAVQHHAETLRAMLERLS